MAKNFAYIRVSTREQKEDRQIDSLNGLKVDEIIVEKASGKNFVGREKYQQMKAQLRNGDLLIVKSIDRLGRNYKQICNEWESLVNMGVDIQVLDMPILNTRNNQNGLTGSLITDIVLKLLSYVAERERDNIKTRQTEGIASAKSRGVKFGRPKTELPKDFLRAYELYQNGLIKVKDVMSMCNIAKSTFYKYVESIKG
ncbi:TPA: resolvase [Candidatus Gastranaerophilales bacterium HUM_8]|nr:MAG TPA: resolvase [Candidatus Gastranaerophilales bacterium HUM_8]DAA99031.1 MAG TPA: resolvase [Candidatus Gastranaerophilales bacterium HUM_11]